jgi:hypothetical protein
LACLDVQFKASLIATFVDTTIAIDITNFSTMSDEQVFQDAPTLPPPGDLTSEVIIDSTTTAEQDGFRTPESITSSIADYSPITPAVAHRERYAYDASKSEISLLNTTINNDKDNDNDFNDDTTRIPDSISVNTFSSDEEYGGIGMGSHSHFDGGRTLLDADDEIFEHFNGSTKDLASPHQSPNGKQRQSTTTSLNVNKIRDDPSRSFASVSASVIAEAGTEAESDTSATANVERNKFKAMARKITPVSKEQINADRQLKDRVAETEYQFKDLDTKAFKLEREITYVDKLLKELNYANFRATDKLPLEIQKLLYARGKLVERLQTAKKTRYDVGVTLSKLRRKLYGDNGGDMTGYFARNVSQ